MKKAIWKLVSLLLYSNLWIAVAAVVLTLQTQFTFNQQLEVGKLHLFILASTLFVYAAHRLVTLKKLESNQWQERFFYISKAQRSIFAYATFAALSSCFLFIQLPQAVQWIIVAPGILSLAYVFPVLQGNRRIRDIHFLKIFLIALVWAWVTVILPIVALELPVQSSAYLLFGERVCFIFAITLPFDVRDLLLDQQQSVKTLPGIIGIKAARQLAGSLLLLCLSANLLLWVWDVYSIGQLSALFLTEVVAFLLIYKAHPEQPDYYFTGYLDGTMILQFVLFYLFSLL